MSTENESSINLIQSVVKGRTTHTDEMFQYMHLIDLGYVQGYNPDGTVNILSLFFNDGQRITYNNCEVLYPGTASGVFSCCADGGLCLVINPMSNMPNTDTGIINIGQRAHSGNCLKAIPLSSGVDTNLQVGFDNVGNFHITGNGVNFQMTKEESRLSFGSNTLFFLNDGELGSSICNNTFQISTDENNILRVIKYDEDNIPQFMYTINSDGSYTIKRNATKAFEPEDYDDLDGFTDWLWIEQYNTDGSISKVLQQDADTPLLTHSIASDGSVTDTLSADSGQKYTLNVGDDVSIVVDGSAKSITFTTGDVTEERKDGGWSINVNGPITLEASDSSLLTLKNAASSLYTVLNDIISVLNNGSCATAGSPAAHTITAGQFSTALSDLQALLGQ